MDYQVRLENATKKAKKLVIISLVVLFVVIVGVFILGRINRDERTIILTEKLKGNIFGYTMVLPSVTVTYKIEFDAENDNKGSMSYYGDRSDTGKMIYSISYDYFGMEHVYLDILYSDGYKAKWDLLIGKNSDGDIAVLDHIDDGHSLFRNRAESMPSKIIYTNAYLKTLFTFTLIAVCVTNIISLCNIAYIKYKYKNNEKRKLEENEYQKIESKKQFLLNNWNTQMQSIGFDKTDSVEIAVDNWFWIANEKMYEAEGINNFINRYLTVEKDIYENIHSEIPTASIQYFSKEGDIQYTTKITGGGGGGSSLTGAIIGGLLAGDAGAIVGSRKKIQDIKSECVTHDSRQTIIRYFSGNELIMICYEGFEVYNYLLKKIPEKDLLSIQLKQVGKPLENSINVSSDIEEKLLTIKTIYENGLISKEEFECKKKEILSKI